MARIFTALTSPADSSSAFLREAGAGAKTFMDAQRQQDAEERAEAEERRAVEGHQLDMEAGRISIAARETIAAQAKLQNDAAAIQASAVAGEMSTLVKDGQKLVDGGYIDPAMMAQMQALNEAREGALLRGEDVRAHDMAIEAMSQDFQAKVVAGRGEQKVDGLRSRIGQLQNQTGEQLTPEQEKSLEDMEEGELEGVLNNLLRAQHEMKQIESSKESYRSLAAGWTAVGAEAEAARGLFMSDVIDGILPMGVDTAAEAQQYYAQMAGQLSVAMLPQEGREFLKDSGYEGWQGRSDDRAADLTEERRTQSAGLAEWMAANPIPQSQPGVISAADLEQDEELRNIANAGPGGGVGAGGELPEEKYVGEDEDEEPMDRSLPGEGAKAKTTRKPTPTKRTKAEYVDKIITGGKRRKKEGSFWTKEGLVGDIEDAAYFSVEMPYSMGLAVKGLLWDLPAAAISNVALEVADWVATPGKPKMSEEGKKAIVEKKKLVASRTRDALKKAPPGVAGTHALYELGSSVAKGNIVWDDAEFFRGIMTKLTKLSDMDREQDGPISQWVESILDPERREREASAGGPAIPMGVFPVGEEGTDVLSAGGDLLEGVRSVVKEPKTYGFGKEDGAVVKRLGALETLLARAVEEQDVERVQSLMGQVEKLMRKVKRSPLDMPGEGSGLGYGGEESPVAAEESGE